MPLRGLYACTGWLLILFFPSDGLQNDITRQRFIAYGGLSLADFSVVATEYVPALKWLSSSASGDHENVRVLTEENTDCDLVNSEDGESQTSDEEIEDW